MVQHAKDKVLREADVAVIGGGPSGVAAAVAAAREGARVVLIEQCGFLGGASTAMLVPCFCPFSDGRQPISTGIGLQVLEQMKQRTGNASAQLDWVPIDHEVLKVLYDEMTAHAGVQVLLHRFLCGADSAGGRVDGLLVADKAGLHTVRARVFVDCTGDGDLAVHAGARFALGDDLGRVQGATLCFTLIDVDRQRFLAYLEDSGDTPAIPRAMARAREQGDLQIPDLLASAVIWHADNVAGMNFGHVYDTDASDPEQVSQGLVEGRRLVQHLTAFLREYVPGFAKAKLQQTGSLLGVRETRRIIGDYCLTLDDYLARRSFPDDIARSSYNIDLHAATADEKRDARYGTAHEPYFYNPGESHGIPYRCLTPAGLHNVLMAGRCISTDRLVNAAIRVMPPCFATGEAAGTAAAMTAALPPADDAGVRDIDVEALRERLRHHGARVDEESRIRPL